MVATPTRYGYWFVTEKAIRADSALLARRATAACMRLLGAACSALLARPAIASSARIHATLW